MINFITYFLIALPIGYTLAFGLLENHAGPNGPQNGANITSMLKGVRGLWTGYIFAYCNQISLYSLVIYCIADWNCRADAKAVT